MIGSSVHAAKSVAVGQEIGLSNFPLDSLLLAAVPHLRMMFTVIRLIKKLNTKDSYIIPVSKNILKLTGSCDVFIMSTDGFYCRFTYSNGLQVQR